MSFFKNKHVIASFIVAPILALISFFAVDHYVSERPHQAVEGQTYTFLAKSNCRWASGQCDLENGNLELSLMGDVHQYGNNHISLSANKAIDNINYAIVSDKGVNSSPMAMDNINSDGLSWRSQLVSVDKTDYMQLVISTGGSQFFAEIPLVFIYKEPVYQ